ncbi:sigma 54-interacting transcriptional regulator [Dehalobacter sp. DCM]|uniref:sigma-54-dependent Fis family transcriptional regulator n=1 Tax=Dehalobacter sp. DCM TaxID=2907827 RepID=UPI00308137C1|nr:sigma 54-interacting transcriptional regulator [Dehalobacter sp. DCM]
MAPLSAISKMDDPRMIDQSQFITQEQWEQIIIAKTRFLENEDEDPLKNKYVNKDIAESWIRSRKMGVNPYIKTSQRQLNALEYSKVIDKNQLLVEITEPLMKRFKDMAVLNSGYILYLCDYNGVFLLQEGDMIRRVTEGLIWNESTIGTCAHCLCLQLKKPVQILGPEHYCIELHDIVGTAAPIHDESGEIIATLILGQRIIERPWLESFQNIRSHTMGLITALAAAVDSQLKLSSINLKLKESYDQLRKVNQKVTTAHDTLEATLTFIDEGILTIDCNGVIIHSNKEANRILKMKQGEIGLRHISEFLSDDSRIMSLVKKGKYIELEETLIVGNDEQPYMIMIRPVLDKETHEADGAVLRLNHAEKVNALIARRSGGIARYHFEDILGENKEFKRIIELAQRFALSPENVLLIGESGTGKELFAQSIHNTYRPKGPFMAVNCAAMPRELIESELFGYEGGSFTGAERAGRPGKIELANEGTLFLDEIGDMPLELQAVLLRTLEDKQVMRIGGRSYKKVDFRLIVATNKNIYQMVKENQFREDLYFRLSVLTINIPPLRERSKTDIEILSNYFVRSYCEKQAITLTQISPEAQKIINEYHWPGNVRQLQNAMIYAVNTAQDNTIWPDDLPSYILLDTSPLKFEHIINNGGNIAEVLRIENLEKTAIKTAMQHTSNDILVAAEILGLSRSTLYRKIKEYNLEL